MKKRLLSILLIVVMALLPQGAHADGFARSRTYRQGQFADVPGNAWYAAAVKDSYELGLMNGSGNDTFKPNGMFTVAEAVTIAARLHSIYGGGNGTFPSGGGAWYAGAVSYAVQNGIITYGQFWDYEQAITRAEMAGVIARALPDSQWAAKNNVTALPDVVGSTDCSDAIFKLYNAGVFGGSDEYGAFQPYAYITRAEVAAIVARCADPSQRLTLNLTSMSQRALLEIPGFSSRDSLTISDGLIRVQDPDTKLYGFMNWKGDLVYNYIFSDAGNFSDGYAWVETTSNNNGTKLKTIRIINAQGDMRTAVEAFSEYKGNGYKITYSKTNQLGNGAYTISYRLNQELTSQGVYKKHTDYFALVIAGQYIGDQFSSVYDNELFIVANRPDGSSTIYDYSGQAINQFDKTFFYYSNWSSINNGSSFMTGSPLLALKGNNKCALATTAGMITPEIYDDVILFKNSNLAMVRIGSQYGLAGPNGIIFGIGEYKVTSHPIVGNYASVKKDGKCYLANLNGILPGFEVALKYSDSYGSIQKTFSDGIHDYVFLECGDYLYYDVSSGNSYPTKNSYNNYNYNYCYEKEDGGGFTFDGIPYLSKKDFRELNSVCNYYAFEISTGKWGLTDNGLVVVDAVYDTPEEALAHYNFYKVDSSYGKTGKPAVVYGNSATGFTPVIQYYQNDLYFDSIIDLGEGYYACRYDTTWYLVHA